MNDTSFNDWKKDRIASAQNGTNPTVLAKMKSGFAVFGDAQFLPGYCVLLRAPKIACLNDLPIVDRAAFLADMSIVGDAIMEVCKPLRINYEILGNTDTFLHAHIFPRYSWEDERLRIKPVWLYPPENWSFPEHQYTQEKFKKMQVSIQHKLLELTDIYYK